MTQAAAIDARLARQARHFQRHDAHEEVPSRCRT